MNATTIPLLLATTLLLACGACHSVKSSADTVGNDSCRLTPAALAEWNKEVYEGRIEKARRISPEDSALFAQLDIDPEQQISERIDRIERLIAGKNWKRMSIYLWSDPAEAERLATTFGFESPSYFAYFLMLYERPNPCREKVIADIRERVYAETMDTLVFSMNSYDLLRYSFAVNVKNYHTH